MSTAAPPTSTPQAAGRARSRSAKSYDLQVPRDEKVASMLIAMVIFVTVLVAALFVVWLTYQIFRPVQTVPMSIPRAKGGESEAFGNNDDLEPPGVEEVPELSTPTLEDTRLRLMDAVGRVSAELDNPNIQGEGVPGGRGLGGRGDDEGRGDGGDVDAIPRYLRWKINFIGTTLETYAKQLDYFKIELAVARGSSDEIAYARDFAKGKAVTRTGSRAFERRSRFEWESGSLREADRQLLSKAGINIGPG
ncbi:MAG: hypothetical protein IIA67_13925, partial [Planctomycetes bacterium]|nr:hypothetical protein [Planctomycetota bacterium]